MRVLFSSVRPTGHVAVVRLPDGAAFVARFLDDGTDRDVTGAVADLLLSGALDAAQASADGRPEPAETVEVVQVHYTEPLLPGQAREGGSFSWLHLPTGEAEDFDPQQVLRLVARGISVELTAGVAAEAADVPDTVEPPGATAGE